MDAPCQSFGSIQEPVACPVAGNSEWQHLRRNECFDTGLEEDENGSMFSGQYEKLQIGAAPQIETGKPKTNKDPLTCQVGGCGKHLGNEKGYYQRYRVCEDHLRSLSMLVDGRVSRFCQQCGRFHQLSDFDGSKRSCRARLMEHNTRRRTRMAAAAAACDGGGSESVAPQQSQAVRKSTKRSNEADGSGSALSHMKSEGDSCAGSPPFVKVVMHKRVSAVGGHASQQGSKQEPTALGTLPSASLAPGSGNGWDPVGASGPNQWQAPTRGGTAAGMSLGLAEGPAGMDSLVSHHQEVLAGPTCHMPNLQHPEQLHMGDVMTMQQDACMLNKLVQQQQQQNNSLLEGRTVDLLEWQQQYQEQKQHLLGSFFEGIVPGAATSGSEVRPSSNSSSMLDRDGSGDTAMMDSSAPHEAAGRDGAFDMARMLISGGSCQATYTMDQQRGGSSGQAPASHGLMGNSCAAAFGVQSTHAGHPCRAPMQGAHAAAADVDVCPSMAHGDADGPGPRLVDNSWQYTTGEGAVRFELCSKLDMWLKSRETGSGGGVAAALNTSAAATSAAAVTGGSGGPFSGLSSGPSDTDTHFHQHQDAMHHDAMHSGGVLGGLCPSSLLQHQGPVPYMAMQSGAGWNQGARLFHGCDGGDDGHGQGHRSYGSMQGGPCSVTQQGPSLYRTMLGPDGGLPDASLLFGDSSGAGGGLWAHQRGGNSEVQLKLLSQLRPLSLY